MWISIPRRKLRPCSLLLTAMLAILLGAPAAFAAANPETLFAEGAKGMIGPNAGGTLLLHSNPTLTYTSDDPGYCGQTQLTACANANTRRDAGTAVIHVLAAFDPSAAPRLMGAVFGVMYPASVHIVDGGRCSDFDLPSEFWPASGEGIAVSWTAPQTQSLVECYWFAAYGEEASPGTLDLAPHPVQGAYFADDHIPARLDPIAGLGRFGFFQAGARACPDAPGMGACCHDSGECQVVTLVQCLQSGGVYQGDDVPCAPNPCPQPGACCYPDGHCSLTTSSVCSGTNGNYLGNGVPCDPNPCPPPRGACCFPNGTCTMLTESECTGGGGVWRGYPSVCTPNPCPQPIGACCLSNGDCLLRTRLSCGDAGGQWLWPLTCSPNPCPQPIGACCFPSGECQVIARDVCESTGGTFRGGGTTCNANPCPQPAAACCFPDGVCQYLLQTNCLNAGGEWQGYPSTCNPNPCPQPCGDRSDADPERPVRAAAPRPPSDPFAHASRAQGVPGPNFGGTLLLHHDPSVVYTSDESGYCGQSALAGCEDANTRHDAVGEPIALSVIAAFHAGNAPRLAGVTFGIDYGTCIEIADGGSCGDFELHTSDWPQSGSGTAVTWDVAQTDHLVEVYWFAAYSEIDYPELLRLTPHPTGGGFFADDSVPSRLDVIAGYGKFGFFTTGTAPCPLATPTGACCHPDGSCDLGTEAHCASESGQYLGDGTDCQPNPCPQPLGACCIPDGLCAMRTDADCQQHGGVWQGYPSSCDPNPCPQPCGDRTDQDPERPVRPSLPIPPANPFGASAGGERGPNFGGTLFLHHDPSLVYTSDQAGYCGQGQPVGCDDAITRHDTINETIVLTAIAAFHPTISPRLAGVTFGVQYGTCVEILASGSCGDFELADSGWPGSGTGTAVTWLSAETDRLVEVYWFAAYSEIDYPEYLWLIPHPTQGAFFADDAIPSHLDPIAGLGAFGFLTAGSAPCPEPAPRGACCLSGAGCEVLTQDECLAEEGKYLGDDTNCSGNPCSNCGALLTGAIDPSRQGPEGSPATPGKRTAPAPIRGGCGTFNLNADGSYENGFTWEYDCVQPPDWGAFAECYSGSGNTEVCSVVLDLTQIGNWSGQRADIYVWADAGGIPGNVVCSSPGYNPGNIATWPVISRHLAFLSGCCVDGNFWVGYWGNWPGQQAAWYVGADLDGFGGCPFTNVAPGAGFPTGWNNVSVIWGPTQAIGIGAETNPCSGTPTKNSTWGAIKRQFEGQPEKK